MQDKKIIKQLKTVKNQIDGIIKQLEKPKSGERGGSLERSSQAETPAKKPGQFTPLRFSMKVNK